MSGIIGSLQMGLSNLSNMQAGLQVVNENVANVNTPGYARRRIIFQPGPVEVRPFGTIGSGAEIQTIQSVRDAFTEGRILFEYSSLGYHQGQQYGVSQLQTVVAPGDAMGISDQLSKFFDSFLALAGDPSSTSLRQIVLSEGDALAGKFRSTMDQLDTLDLANRARIEDSVHLINELTVGIAEINQRLQPMLNRGQDGGPLYDQRQVLLNQLSEQLGVQVQVDSTNTMVITTTTGRLLVVGAESFALESRLTGPGMTVTYQGEDISSEISGGSLGGLVDFQNSTLTSARASLDTLAAELVRAVNQAHSAGIDLDGAPGGPLFSAAAGSESRTIAFELSDYRMLAAGAPGTSIGDGSNAQALADLRDLRLPGLGDQTVTEYFSQIVFDVGLAARTVESNVNLQQKVLRQLESQRESVSGVSLDEEAVNLIQYQRSYQASAKLIRALDQLLEETLNLVG